MQFSDETLALVNKIIKRYPEGKQKSALLPCCIWRKQSLMDGSVTE